MNVNFNKMPATFDGLVHSIYINYTSHKQVMKSGGSSSEHYFSLYSSAETFKQDKVFQVQKTPTQYTDKYFVDETDII